ncbi:MAG TPA: protein kinase [Polyangiaceae bacterium]|nr:protein kinase [Polyangiaceae bacterium]
MTSGNSSQGPGPEVGAPVLSESAPLVPGQVLAGKYRIEQVLGSGGMGVVVAARHLRLKHRVALKLLRPEGSIAPEAVARLLREAQHATAIQSEHVVRVTDLGALPNGWPYLVMEYLEGNDLGQLLQRNGPLPEGLAVDYLLQALTGVAEAHALGIVHRDLKPTNLFLTERSDGTAVVKVLDFGISKLTKPGAAVFDLTRTGGALMGSPLYMAPEQIRSAKLVDIRADVWSLGVILHQFLTGRPPFTGDDLTAVLAAIIADEPRSVREHAPHVSPGLDHVILRCLEKDRNRRYQNVGELATALRPFAPEESRSLVRRIVATVGRGGAVLADSASDAAGTVAQPSSSGAPVLSERPPPSVTATATASATASAWVQPTAPIKRGRLLKSGAALICLGAVVAGVAYELTRASTPAAAISANPVEVGSAPPLERDPGADASAGEAPPLPAVPAPAPTTSGAPSSPTAAEAPGGGALRQSEKAGQARIHAVPPRPKARKPASQSNPTKVPDVSDLINERH